MKPLFIARFVIQNHEKYLIMNLTGKILTEHTDKYLIRMEKEIEI